ncbi:MAG: ATP-binding protein [Candidatus Magnetobacterium sp. LHC-1]
MSFKDKVTLSMVAADIEELQENRIQTDDPEWHLLRGAAIYGANASGKSNLIKAMAFMKRFVLNSSRETQYGDYIATERFKFSVETENKPSSFEISFISGVIRYTYGFDVDNSRVHREWLYSYPDDEETILFNREQDNVEIVNFEEGKGLEDKTRSNALFLSVAAQFNGKTAKNIFDWFANFKLIRGLDDEDTLPHTLSQLNDAKRKDIILDLLNRADLQIKDVRELINFDVMLSDIASGILIDNLHMERYKHSIEKKKNTIRTATFHTLYNAENEEVGKKIMPLLSESEGTRKILSLAGLIVDALIDGEILVIDEMDARLHPNITSYLIKLFNRNNTNAQLIIATHDTNLLNNRLYRRDQVWFTEKDRYGATALYSLVEFKLTGDESYEKDYISGRYGAIPFIGGNISSLIK